MTKGTKELLTAILTVIVILSGASLIALIIPNPLVGIPVVLAWVWLIRAIWHKVNS